MRAAVVDRYGPPDVVRVTEVPRPQPRAPEALVRIKAAAVTSADSRVRAARFPPGFGLVARLALGLAGPRRPILGSSFSGIVEAVGERVTDFAQGDEVCGMTGTRMGAHAEFLAVPAAELARKPPAVDHQDAAGLLFGGTTALFFLQRQAVGPGTSVLVNGASGAVGTNAVQVAKHLGATVTAVTGGANAALLTGLGADRVIDYTRDDLTAVRERFDVVLDAVGNLSKVSGRNLLSGKGLLVLAVAGLWDTVTARGNVITRSAPERVEDFDLLLGLVATGTLTVVHDRAFELPDIVDPYRLVDSGRKIGNVIVRP